MPNGQKRDKESNRLDNIFELRVQFYRDFRIHLIPLRCLNGMYTKRLRKDIIEVQRYKANQQVFKHLVIQE